MNIADNRVNGGFRLDYFSIMNIGNELGNRHLDYILVQLNSRIPNTTFYIV
jgi:urease accessory protein UreE